MERPDLESCTPDELNAWVDHLIATRPVPLLLRAVVAGVLNDGNAVRRFRELELEDEESDETDPLDRYRQLMHDATAASMVRQRNRRRLHGLLPREGQRSD